ncbi:MAG: hypothetical protein ACWA5T_04955 [Parvularcula sp.]
MLSVRSCLLGSVFLALAACGGGSPDAASQNDADQPKEAAPIEVALTDGLGQFDGKVSGLALWQHPTVSYQSAVLAANGEAGLFMIPIDRSEPTSVEGNFSGAVAIGYTGTEAVAAAYDSDLGGVRIFAVDPATKSLSEFAVAATSDGAKALCFVGATLFRIADDGAVYRHQMMVEDGAVVVDVQSVPDLSGQACASGTDKAYILTTGGRVRPATRLGELQPSEDAPEGAVSIAAFSTAAGDQLVFALEDGTVIADDKPLLIADSAGPLAMKLIVAGGGNFGGAYRDGALGIVSKENDLGIVSWLAISNTVGLEGRSISPQGEDAGVSADLARQRVRPEGEISRELDEEAKERLDSFRSPPSDEPSE